MTRGFETSKHALSVWHTLSSKATPPKLTHSVTNQEPGVQCQSQRQHSHSNHHIGFLLGKWQLFHFPLCLETAAEEGILDSLVNKELVQASINSPLGTKEQKAQKRKLYVRKRRVQRARVEEQFHQQQASPLNADELKAILGECTPYVYTTHLKYVVGIR